MLRIQASKSWCQRMYKWNGIAYRHTNSLGQQIPPYAPDRCDRFLSEMKPIYNDYEIIVNMDETALYFEIPSNKTFGLKGVTAVKVKTSGNETFRFICVLTAGVTRDWDYLRVLTLPPDLHTFIKGHKGNFPVLLLLEGSEGDLRKLVKIHDNLIY